MILVDTSVWIDLFGRRPRFRFASEKRFDFVTCGPIIQEVIQGARQHAADRLRAGMLALPCLEDPIGKDAFVEAAALYQRARARGFTVRSASDCLIAAIAMRHGAVIWHDDRDYDAIAKVSALDVIRTKSLV